MDWSRNNCAKPGDGEESEVESVAPRSQTAICGPRSASRGEGRRVTRRFLGGFLVDSLSESGPFLEKNGKVQPRWLD